MRLSGIRCLLGFGRYMMGRHDHRLLYTLPTFAARVADLPTVSLIADTHASSALLNINSLKASKEGDHHALEIPTVIQKGGCDRRPVSGT